MVQLIFYQFIIRKNDDEEGEGEAAAAAAENKIERLPVIKFPFGCPPLKIAAYFIRKIFLSANNKKNCRTHTLYRRASIAIFRLSCLRFKKLFLLLSRPPFTKAKWQIQNTLCTISYHTRAHAHTQKRYEKVF